jgi:hypothetical protein
MNKDIAVYLYSLIILSTKTEQIANKIWMIHKGIMLNKKADSEDYVLIPFIKILGKANL